MYKRGAKGWEKHLDFILFDCLCIVLSFFAAYQIRHGWTNPFADPLFREMMVVIILMDFLVILVLDTMKNVLKRGYYLEFKATIIQSLVLLVGIVTYMYSIKVGEKYSRIIIFLTIVIYSMMTYLVRILWKNHLRKNINHLFHNALLIIASEKSAKDLIHEVQNHDFTHHQMVGLVLPSTSDFSQLIQEVPVVASYDTLIDYVTRNWVDEILVSVDCQKEFPENLMNQLISMGVTVHLSLEKNINGMGIKQVVSNVGGMQVLSSTLNYMTPRQYSIKRCMDIIGGVIGCLVTGILYLFLAPVIKSQSPGTVFFTQQRIGKNGKPFTMYKFRSMYMDAEERKKELLDQNRRNDNLMFKMDFDPRVIGNKIDKNGQKHTGIGEFIRKYSLDEFPQFYNVLKGDMSMVGTRPPLPDEYADYSAHHKARLAVQPGITGLWQVSGRSDILDFEDVVQLDTYYINNWSIGMDLKIIVKTISVILKKEGSM